MSDAMFIPASEFCSYEYHQKLQLEKKLLKDNALKAIEDKNATFDDLVIIEPALKWLLDDALDFKKQNYRKRNVCANDRWYGYRRWNGLGLKGRLSILVGWESKKAVLKNEYCYSLAYEHIYHSLPNCRNCGCY